MEYCSRHSWVILMPPEPNRVRARSASALKNAGWLYADQVLRAGFSLVVFAALTRYLGPERFGVLSYAIAFPALILPLCNLGLDFAVVQELVRRRENETCVLSTAFVLLCMSSLLGIVLGLGIATAFPIEHPARKLLYITVFSLGAQPFQVFDFYFQSLVASRFSVVARVGASVMANLLRLALVLSEGALPAFAVVGVVEAFLSALGLYVAFRGSKSASDSLLWRSASVEEAGRLMKIAWPLMLGGCAMAVYTKLDQMILAGLSGVRELGRYAAAVRLADASQFATYAIIGSTFPSLVKIHATEPLRFVRAVSDFMKRMTWLAIAIALIISLLGPYLTPLVLGEQYRETAVAFSVLAWANVFAAQIGVRGKWLLLYDRQTYSLVFFGCGAAAHLFGLWLLAPVFGALGAALSYLLAQAFMALAIPFVFRETRESGFVAWSSLLCLRRQP